MKELLHKKTTKIGIAAIILAVVIGLIGINARSAQRQKEYDSHVEAAEKYLTELDYEQAIAEYTLALEIEPNNEELLNALEQTYLDYAQSLADTGEYEKAVSVLEEGYAQTGRESLREKIEELKAAQEQIVAKEAEAQRIAEETEARMIEFPFELTDITIMGYDLFSDHYEDVCAAYGCPVDTDPVGGGHLVNNEYGRLVSEFVAFEDDTEYKIFDFSQNTEDFSYSAFYYSCEKIYNGVELIQLSIDSSFDKVTDLESCNIHVPAVPTGDYEDWNRAFQVDEIMKKGELQEVDGTEWWVFQTKWGQAYYTEDAAGDYAQLSIYLTDWTVGEEQYNGWFSIERFVDDSVGGDSWHYVFEM